MVGCWNTAVRDGHLGGKQSKDKMLKTLIPLTMLQGKVNCTHHPANVLKFISHRRICWAIYTCQIRMHSPCLFLRKSAHGCIVVLWGLLWCSRQTEALKETAKLWGWHRGVLFLLLHLCPFLCLSGCERQGRLSEWLWGHPGILKHLSVSVYTEWLYRTPTRVCLHKVTDWLGWHVDIPIVSALLLDTFRQKGDDSPCLSCLTGTVYGWKRLQQKETFWSFLITGIKERRKQSVRCN